MLVYRILLAKYATQLMVSGNPARWSSRDVFVLYTASSRSLACLENVVHRPQQELSLQFSILTIEFPDHIQIKSIELGDLPADWTEYDQMRFTQTIGDAWVKKNKTAILKVPSAIVNEEINYLLNPKYPDFKFVKLIKVQPFVFDGRIKQ